ncbi:hypothetical protein BABINDRAFT_6397 [Babjeviella inositovora NRRL Y-12698]|uniref:V-type proton ATPase subunit G n=1 Tax=Babjeviella inositovora NRRL Y-12698 TaxID=984486 RepID=A0A1E3QXE4_9ASCO|nr:uncharacterized protein BABINDRAFT_6397 [Babjeviella inositovora NRRL Y-12698]ODQ81742.1 hypothetical protein BABINDRAFT_6397 [Babjeviella inositovora NRRL Y-12698]
MSQQGIQKLLNAEKEAHKIIAEARNYRSDKLKQAKSDASAEIAKIKVAKESELKQFESQHSGLNEEADKQAEQLVKDELAKIEKIAGEKRGKVVKLLIDAVIKPTPEIHINAAK